MLAPSQEVQDLIRARNLIADPERWCVGNLAETANGRGCEIESPAAQKFCALGAIIRVADDRDYSSSYDFLCKASVELYPQCDGYISAVNNDLGHEATLRMYERAIEIAAQRVTEPA